MKIIVLSVGDQIYSTRRIVEEAEHRGHLVRVVNHTKCTLKLGQGRPAIYYKGENIIDFPDALIPRIGGSVGQHGAALVKEFEMRGVTTCASALGILEAQNKMSSLQTLSRKNLPIPPTSFSINPAACEAQIDLLGGVPIIIKLHEGTQGLGVILAETKESAISMMDTLYAMNAKFMLQAYIKEAKGEDIRAIVIGSKVVAAMKRRGNKGEFRANLHRGGTGEKVHLSPEEIKLAVKACKLLNLGVAGVDMIRSTSKALLMEVNASPGIQGVEAYTKVNIAEEIIKYLESEVRRKF